MSLYTLFITGCSSTIKSTETITKMDEEHVKEMNCKRMRATLTVKIQNDIRFNHSNEDLADALQDTKRVYKICIDSNEPYFYELYEEIFYDPYNRIDYLKQIENEIEERKEIEQFTENK